MQFQTSKMVQVLFMILHSTLSFLKKSFKFFLCMVFFTGKKNRRKLGIEIIWGKKKV